MGKKFDPRRTTTTMLTAAMGVGLVLGVRFWKSAETAATRLPKQIEASTSPLAAPTTVLPSVTTAANNPATISTATTIQSTQDRHQRLNSERGQEHQHLKDQREY